MSIQSLGLSYPASFILCFLWIFASRYAVHGYYPCVPRSFGESSVVCTCNSTYCDTFPALGNIDVASFAVYSSTKGGERFVRSLGSISNKTSQSPDVVIDSSKTYQSIIGFGGAVTDAASLNIFSLSDSARQKLLEAYFSPSGIEYTLGRIPIASTDFSTHAYTYHDIEDLQLRNFSLATEDLKLKIPLIKSAMQMSKKNIRFFATAWTAPKWMKTSNSYTGRGYLKGSAGGPYFKAWANYLVKFLDAYKDNGIPMWGLTAQNEPVDGRVPFFPFQCMGFTDDMERDFIGTDLGPALQAAGYGGLKLMALDDSIAFLPSWAKTMYGNVTSSKYISGIAVHWYENAFFSYNRLTETHNVNPNKFVLATEACAGSMPLERKVILGDWGRAEQYANDIMKDLQNWVTGWTDWNIALNMSGGPNWVNNNVDSPIIVNKGEFYKQPMYYALGHFSKFLTPDSVRMSMKITNKNIDGVAFSTPEKLFVTVLINTNDDDENITIQQDTNSLQVNVKGHSINTIVWRKQ